MEEEEDDEEEEEDSEMEDEEARSINQFHTGFKLSARDIKKIKNIVFLINQIF